MARRRVGCACICPPAFAIAPTSGHTPAPTPSGDYPPRASHFPGGQRTCNRRRSRIIALDVVHSSGQVSLGHGGRCTRESLSMHLSMHPRCPFLARICPWANRRRHSQDIFQCPARTAPPMSMDGVKPLGDPVIGVIRSFEGDAEGDAFPVLSLSRANDLAQFFLIAITRR